MNLKLKKPNKKTDEIIKYDMTALTGEDLRTEYAIEIQNRFNCLMEITEEEVTERSSQNDIGACWNNLKQAINKTNEKLLPKKKTEA
ncbi:hypothetical protein ElyMa_004011900 [Elysia marginata]|uniref:Uncharacterized protein n=1 Tax=Elysia marginata TaxID=1093978 RepID=A0AAV4G094_9GAST|nr:hypothetical protein ElyMa_004011900 [Elysia marginata]